MLFCIYNRHNNIGVNPWGYVPLAKTNMASSIVFVETKPKTKDAVLNSYSFC